MWREEGKQRKDEWFIFVRKEQLGECKGGEGLPCDLFFWTINDHNCERKSSLVTKRSSVWQTTASSLSHRKTD